MPRCRSHVSLVGCGRLVRTSHRCNRVRTRRPHSTRKAADAAMPASRQPGGVRTPRPHVPSCNRVRTRRPHSNAQNRRCRDAGLTSAWWSADASSARPIVATVCGRGVRTPRAKPTMPRCRPHVSLVGCGRLVRTSYRCNHVRTRRPHSNAQSRRCRDAGLTSAWWGADVSSARPIVQPCADETSAPHAQSRRCRDAGRARHSHPNALRARGARSCRFWRCRGRRCTR